MFFVILNHPNGGVVPLMEGDSESNVATFQFEDAAKRAIGDNMLGHHYGGKVFNTDEPFSEV